MLIIANIYCSGDKSSVIKIKVFLQSPLYWERFSSSWCIAMFGKTARVRKKELISIGFFILVAPPIFSPSRFFPPLLTQG